MADQAEVPSGHKAFYQLSEIAILVAFRVKPPGEEMRTTVDKVRKRLLYALGQDELHLLGPPGLQLLFAAEVFAWARRKWPDAFGDIKVTQEATAESKIGFADQMHGDVIPGDLERCQATLQDAYRTIHHLERELAAVSKEADQLRPLAERYKQNREKNRSSAKLPRKV